MTGDDLSPYTSHMETFSEVIDLWPHVAQLAEDIGEKPDTVRKWRTRGKIPSHAWAPLIDSAKRRGIKGINAEVLARLASRH